MKARAHWNQTRASYVVVNTPARVMLVAVLLAPLVGLAVFELAFPRMSYYASLIPWPLAVGLIVVFVLAIWLMALSRLFTRVELAKDTVALRNPLRKRIVHREEVAEVTINPPPNSPKLEQGFWGEIDAVGRIRLHSGRSVPLLVMFNGLKYRIAGILDPERHPENAAWVEEWFQSRGQQPGA